MTIKEIKEKCEKTLGDYGHLCYKSTNYSDEHGRIIVVMAIKYSDFKTVVGAIRASDGVNLIKDRCRACSSMDDAVDVAYEMIEIDHS